MGYYSDVTCVVTKEVFAEMWKLDSDTMNKVTEMCRSITKRDGSILMYWDSIKWSDCYTVIGKFENLLFGMDYDHYHFMRLGEHRSDFEDKGGYWDNPFDARLVRSLEFDSGEPLKLDVFR